MCWEHWETREGKVWKQFRENPILLASLGLKSEAFKCSYWFYHFLIPSSDTVTVTLWDSQFSSGSQSKQRLANKSWGYLNRVTDQFFSLFKLGILITFYSIEIDNIFQRIYTLVCQSYGNIRNK